jgi:hypothetical protein
MLVHQRHAFARYSKGPTPKHKYSPLIIHISNSHFKGRPLGQHSFFASLFQCVQVAILDLDSPSMTSFWRSLIVIAFHNSLCCTTIATCKYAQLFQLEIMMFIFQVPEFQSKPQLARLIIDYWFFNGEPLIHYAAWRTKFH